MSKKQLFQHYEGILAAAQLAIEDDGSIYRPSSSKKKDAGREYVMVDGKRLVMPFVDLLKRPEDGSLIFFHPFAEEFGKGESPAIAYLRKRFEQTIATKLTLLQAQLAMLAASATPPVVLNSHQQEGLQAIKECTEKVTTEIIQIFERSVKKSTNKGLELTDMYLSRKSPTGEKTYMRYLTVRFPLYEHLKSQQKLKKADRNVYGLKPSDDTLTVLVKLYDIILPNLKNDPAGYSVGSNSEVAPYSDALLRGVSEIFLNINEVARVYSDIMGFDEAVTDEDWTSVIEELPNLTGEILMIPVRGDASGLDKVEDKLAQAQRAVIDSGVTVTATPAPLPYVAPQPAPVAPQPVPVQTPAPAQYTSYQQPGYPVPAPQAPAAAVSEEGKVSYSDMMRQITGAPQQAVPMYVAPQQQMAPAPLVLPPGCMLNQYGQVVNQYGQPVQLAPQQQMVDPMTLAMTPEYLRASMTQQYYQAQPAPGGALNPHNAPVRQAPQPMLGQYPPGYGQQGGYPGQHVNTMAPQSGYFR